MMQCALQCLSNNLSVAGALCAAYEQGSDANNDEYWGGEDHFRPGHAIPPPPPREPTPEEKAYAERMSNTMKAITEMYKRMYGADYFEERVRQYADIRCTTPGRNGKFYIP